MSFKASDQTLLDSSGFLSYLSPYILFPLASLSKVCFFFNHLHPKRLIQIGSLREKVIFLIKSNYHLPCTLSSTHAIPYNVSLSLPSTETAPVIHVRTWWSDPKMCLSFPQLTSLQYLMLWPASSSMNLSTNPADPKFPFPPIGIFRLMISKPTWDFFGVGENTNTSEPPKGYGHFPKSQAQTLLPNPSMLIFWKSPSLRLIETSPFNSTHPECRVLSCTH